MDAETIPLRVERDIVAARVAARDMAAELGFGRVDQTRLATAVSELVRNAVSYGGGGECLLLDESNDATARMRVVVEDQGPGIPDIEQAMQDGFTTADGLGCGLPGTKRLAHDFEIESRPGLTRVTIGFSRNK